MGVLDSLKAWFRTEAAEARDLGRSTQSRLEADLDRREAELALTPEERLDQLQQQIEDDGGLDALRDKIEGRHLRADADAELADIDAEARAAAEDVLDLPSEEVDLGTEATEEDQPPQT
ncbi:MAG: hypothetical protein AAF547_24100 [Actinomycetota bacterium]